MSRPFSSLCSEERLHVCTRVRIESIQVNGRVAARCRARKCPDNCIARALRRDAGEKTGVLSLSNRSRLGHEAERECRRSLELPHFHCRSAAAHYPRDRIAGIHKIGWPTPAGTDRICTQHIVRLAGVSTQVVCIHEEHRTRLPCSHCEVRIRTWLIGKNEHTSGAEIAIPLV